VLTAFLGMYFTGISSNIMSLAGIAIAIGVLVDAGIVVTENAFRVVEQRGIDGRDRPRIRDAVRDSTRLVGRARRISRLPTSCATSFAPSSRTAPTMALPPSATRQRRRPLSASRGTAARR
jgi:hypothetical protein